ncbi:conserved Plasmodium protein, unknown function [Plasmodium reichenowi]|uniref:CCHC-type domain-containing protein n=1 Tax=Plasmodium reichenowi TaxID=5854 RepID=A0A060S498_PLARE|nr:conserved Plasmodium protein, unknown function [Plasmodium reichenowi]
MIETYIYWNFRGSRGNGNILRISLPCSYNTIKKKIMELTNIHIENNLDILLYHNNKILSEYESIHHEMLIEIQRSSIDVVRDMLQKSNDLFLEKNKSKTEVNKNNAITQRTTQNQQKNNNRMINDYNNKISKFNNNNNNNNKTMGYFQNNNRPWNIYNRNNIIKDENKNIHGENNLIINQQVEEAEELDEDEEMKIHLAMEKNNVYKSNYNNNKIRLNYYKRDRNNPTHFMQNKLKNISPHNIIKNNKNGIPNNNITTSNSKVDGEYSTTYHQKNNYLPNIYTHSTYNKFKNHINNNHNNIHANNIDEETINKKVSPDYICHMCGKKGHSIKNCTMSAFNNNKKIKVPTGIPTNFLTKIKTEDIYKYDQIYILKDGSYGVLKDVEDVSGSAYLYRSVEDKINIYLGVNNNNNNNNNNNINNNNNNNKNNISSNYNYYNNSDIPNELQNNDKISNIYKCLLCRKLYTEPVTLHCCAETYCKACLYKYNKKKMKDTSNISSSYHNNNNNYTNQESNKVIGAGSGGQLMKCPSCSKYINSDELIINTNIKNVIDTIVKNQKTNQVNDEMGNKASGNTFVEINNNMNLMDEQHNNNNINNNINNNNINNNNNNSNGVGGADEHNNYSYNNISSHNNQNISHNFTNNSSKDLGYNHNQNIFNLSHKDNIHNIKQNEFYHVNFNPLITFSFNLYELKKEHDFAAAYIAQYKLKKKKKKKRQLNINFSVLNKKIC